ncbi:MAG: hypothetical protein ACK4FJ_00860 [Ferrovibrio sp.]|uniref:hypothetical protein n=1 Tax=Ferrovibrio sp. TaxID=1917215 RepID=UPI00391904B3
MGPITLIDKSFLQSLSFDEAAIFDCLYATNICPIFFVETLADLKKNFPNSKPEDEVGRIAGRTPAMHSYPNVHHRELCLGNLLGQPIEMSRVPTVGGGVPVRSKDGKVGIYFESPPEQKAMSRWHQGRFHEIEQDFAATWRKQLQLSDLKSETDKFLSRLGYSGNPKNLVEAKNLAEELVRGNGRRFATLKAIWSSLGLRPQYWPQVLRKWKDAGGPSLNIFAPYAAFCLTIDVFFYICIKKGLISAERASNKVDVGYLYYLPFCMLFVSNDRLHAQIAPLFLTDAQIFVPGAELKAELNKLNLYYSAMEEVIAKEGLIRVASRPPPGDFLTRRLWESAFQTKVPDSLPLPMKAAKAPQTLLDEVKEMQNVAKKSAGTSFSRQQLADPDRVTLERHVRINMGKWRLFPEGINPMSDVDE